MPVYEVECEKCKLRKEIWKIGSTKGFTRHACECGGIMAQVMSKNTFHLKGKGWYEKEKKTTD